jgi:hypothetical protein
MKASASPAFLILSAQLYFNAADTGFSATAVGVSPGVTGLALLVEGHTTFTVQFSAVNAGQLQVLTLDPDDDTTPLAQQLVSTYPVSGAGFQVLTFGGATTLLPGQVWRKFKLVFISNAGAGNVTAKLLCRS